MYGIIIDLVSYVIFFFFVIYIYIIDFVVLIDYIIFLNVIIKRNLIIIYWLNYLKRYIIKKYL